MPREVRAFWQPKDEGHPKEYEDAFAVDPEKGVAAIADGVSGGMFSGSWAQLLTQGVVEKTPDPRDREQFADWLIPLRGTWDQSIDRANLHWTKKQKLDAVGGGYATLLWLELLPGNPTTEEGEAAEMFRFRSFAVGDCCLFHVRDSQILRTFPMECSADFTLDPCSIFSADRNQDHVLDIKVLEDNCQSGDLLVLVTDALAIWMFRQLESQNSIPWDTFWNMTHEEFAEWLRCVREAGEIRYDDTTLMLLRLTQETAELEAREPEADGVQAGEARIGERPLGGPAGEESSVEPLPDQEAEKLDVGEESSELESRVEPVEELHSAANEEDERPYPPGEGEPAFAQEAANDGTKTCVEPHPEADDAFDKRWPCDIEGSSDPNARPKD